MEGRARQRRSRRWTIFVRVVFVVMLCGIASCTAVGGLIAYGLSDRGRALPGAHDDLDALRRESITEFVPEGATLVSSGDAFGTRSLFFSVESPSAVSRSFATVDVAATMRAFVEPATADGWRLVRVECQRLLNTSELQFVKAVPTDDGKTRGLELSVTSGGLVDGVAVSATAPLYGGGISSETRPVHDLLDTGVPRTDPGCLRDRRDPAQPVGPGPWTDEQICPLVATAWPGGRPVLESNDCYVVIGDAVSFSIRSLGSADPYSFEDQRLSSAGGATMFATVDGGFWLTRPDGVTLSGTYEGFDPLPEAEILRLAGLLAAAPAPSGDAPS